MASPAPLPELSRIESIDIFRGVTVLVMVFVDNLGMVQGLPWWTYHMPREANGMTYVDMVFPAFLFLAGMSIPLAIKRRAASGESSARIYFHVLIRALSLIVLGLFIANAPQVNAPKTHLSSVAWALTGFLGIGLGWNTYPRGAGRRNLYRALQYTGIALLLGMLVIFRRITPDGHAAWLDFSDWEILGLIGWAYLLVSAIYLVAGKKTWALIAALAILVTVNLLSTAGWLHWLDRLPVFLRPFEAGIASMTLSGVVTARIFFDGAAAAPFRNKVWRVLGFAACLFAVALALTPWGISKLRDTPAWCLYCSAANIMIFLFLYWIADVRRHLNWTSPFQKAAGANALLPYLLAYVAYFTPRLGMLTADGTQGGPGVMKSLFFAGAVMVLSFILTRLGIRLRL